MIVNCLSKTALDIFNGAKTKNSRKLDKALHPKAKRLLDQLNAATEIRTLEVPPSNKLKKLEGNFLNFWRIKINQQWAIIFKWQDEHAHDVDIIEYH